METVDLHFNASTRLSLATPTDKKRHAAWIPKYAMAMNARFEGPYKLRCPDRHFCLCFPGSVCLACSPLIDDRLGSMDA